MVTPTTPINIENRLIIKVYAAIFLRFDFCGEIVNNVVNIALITENIAVDSNGIIVLQMSNFLSMLSSYKKETAAIASAAIVANGAILLIGAKNSSTSLFTTFLPPPIS